MRSAHYAPWALAALLGCHADVPVQYPPGYPLLSGGALSADKTSLVYQAAPLATSERLIALLGAEGWTVTFDGGLDPTAGRLITATKAGRTVIANVGAQDQGATVIVRELPKAP